MLCKAAGTNTRYIGESARTLLERSREHQEDALTTNLQGRTSHMKSHFSSEHPGELAEVLEGFQMNITKRASSPLERQVREAIEIARATGGTLLNSKEEYNRCLLPVMILEGPKPIRQQEEEFKLSQNTLDPIEEE